MVRLEQIVDLSCTDTNTISKWTETRFYMTHVTYEFHRVRPKWFLRLCYVWFKLWIYLAPRLTLSPNGPKRDSTWHTSPRSSIGCVQIDFRAYGTFDANRAPILYQDEHNLQTNRDELPFYPRHLGVPSGVSKMISEPMVRLAQIMQLLCTETNTISKRIEMRFYMTHVI
jgi:hypothetical protein